MAREVTTKTGPLSEQGESAAKRAARLWATDAAVDAYVAQAPVEVVQCRERYRHMFPSIREGLTFTRIDRDGFYIRKVGCEVCRYPEGHERAGEYRVVRVETWDVRTKRIKGRPVIVRCDLLKAYTDYRDPEYLARAGQGRMKPKQIRGSMGTALMADVDPVALRKEVMAAVRATADIAPQEERGETA